MATAKTVEYYGAKISGTSQSENDEIFIETRHVIQVISLKVICRNSIQKHFDFDKKKIFRISHMETIIMRNGLRVMQEDQAWSGMILST